MIQIGKVWREALAFLRILSILGISLSRLLRGLLSRLLGILLLVGLLVLSRKVSEFLAELLILLRELKVFVSLTVEEHQVVVAFCPPATMTAVARTVRGEEDGLALHDELTRAFGVATLGEVHDLT